MDKTELVTHGVDVQGAVVLAQGAEQLLVEPVPQRPVQLGPEVRAPGGVQLEDVAAVAIGDDGHVDRQQDVAGPTCNVETNGGNRMWGGKAA